VQSLYHCTPAVVLDSCLLLAVKGPAAAAAVAVAAARDRWDRGNPRGSSGRGKRGDEVQGLPAAARKYDEAAAAATR